MWLWFWYLLFRSWALEGPFGQSALSYTVTAKIWHRSVPKDVVVHDLGRLCFHTANRCSIQRLNLREATYWPPESGLVRDLFWILAVGSAVNRRDCQVAEFLSHTRSLRKIWKGSTTEKTIFGGHFIHRGRDSLEFSDQKVSVGVLTFAFLPQEEKSLLFWGRHFALGTNLEITFHFRFPPKDLKVFWSVNARFPLS